MDQGQAAPLAQAATAAAPPVLPTPPLPPPALPAARAPPAFTLGPACSHAILNYNYPNTGVTATKLCNKAILPLEEKFNGEDDNLAILLPSIRD